MHILLLLASLAFARPVVVALVDPPLVRALQLPIAARAVRHAGVPHAEVLVTLDAVRLHRIHAWDLVVVFDESVVAMRRYGPVPDYGVFVVSRLDRDLHGRALADAIHAEHRSHGYGKDRIKYKEKDGGYSYKVKHDNGHGGHDDGWDRGSSGKGSSGKGNSSRGGSSQGGSHHGNDDDHGKGKGKK
ncbi:MAG: hypothetical protein Q8P18_18885 [Pseudomonadota bacterium]|nr:hypothetical protein [Pseudomonadota bacterium]